MNGEIRLAVAIEVQASYWYAATYRRFEDASGDSSTIPCHLARQPHVHGYHFHRQFLASDGFRRRRRSTSWIETSLMLAYLFRINPLSSNSHISFPYDRIPMSLGIVPLVFETHRYAIVAEKPTIAFSGDSRVPSPTCARGTL